MLKIVSKRKKKEEFHIAKNNVTSCYLNTKKTKIISFGF